MDTELLRGDVRIAFVPEVAALDEDEQTVTHMITTEALDRHGDIVDLAGWDLKNFEKQPSVFVDHDYRIEKIIGKSLSIEKTKRGLQAVTKFTDTGLGPYAFDLVKQGFAGAWSVGFRGNQDHWIQESAETCEICAAAHRRKKKPRSMGRHFTSQELMEYSLVGVAANPDALSLAVSKGLSPEELFESGVLRVPDDLVREQFDAIVRALRETGEQHAAPNEATVEPERVGLYEEILRTATKARRISASIEITNDARARYGAHGRNLS